MDAIEQDNWDQFNKLLKKKPNISALNANSENAYHFAARQKDHRYLRALIEKAKFLDLNASTTTTIQQGDTLLQKGDTPLAYAIRAGHQAHADLLYERGGANLLLFATCQGNIIHYAILSKKLTMLEWVLAKFKQNLPSQHKETAHSIEVSDALILAGKINENKKGLSRLNFFEIINAKNRLPLPAHKNTPLMLAVTQKTPEFIPLLVENKAEINYIGTEANSLSALEIACLNDDPLTVKTLLAHNADIFLGKPGNPALLYYPVRQNNQDILNILLEATRKYCDITYSAPENNNVFHKIINDVDYQGNPLLIVALKNKSPSISMLKQLIDHGATLENEKNLGDSVIVEALSRNSKEIVNFLLTKDNYDWLLEDLVSHHPLCVHYAAINPHSEVMSYLLDKIIFIEQNDKEKYKEKFLKRVLKSKKDDLDNESRIEKALKEYHDDKPLIEKALESQKGTYEHTPLMTAIDKGHTSHIATLLHYGSRIDVEDHHGQTGLQHALIKAEFAEKEKKLPLKKQFLDIAQLLVASQANPDIKDRNKETSRDIVEKYKTTDEAWKKLSKGMEQAEKLISCKSKRSINEHCSSPKENINTEEIILSYEEKKIIENVHTDHKKLLQLLKESSPSKRYTILSILSQELKSIQKKAPIHDEITHFVTQHRNIEFTKHAMSVCNQLNTFFLTRDMLSAGLRGNFEEVVINISMIGVWKLSPELIEHAKIAAAALEGSVSKVLANIIKIGAPTIGHFGTILTFWDLIQQIRNYENHKNAKTMRNIIVDGALIGTDVFTISTEVAEALGVFSEVSEVTPIGTILTAAIIVAAQVLQINDELDVIEKKIHGLTIAEKASIATRTLAGLPPPKYIEKILRSQAIYQKIITTVGDWLKKNPSIRTYMQPAPEPPNKQCTLLPLPRHIAFILKQLTQTQKSDCPQNQTTPFFQRNITILPTFSRYKIIKTNRMKIIPPPGIEIACSPEDPDPATNMNAIGQTFSCQGAIGFNNEHAKKESFVLFDLWGAHLQNHRFPSTKTIEGDPDHSNVFPVHNIQPGDTINLFGGKEKDCIIIGGAMPEGIISGSPMDLQAAQSIDQTNNTNILNITEQFVPKASISIDLRNGFLRETNHPESHIALKDIQVIIGRPGNQENLTANSDTRFVTLNGGKGTAEPDQINIPPHNNHLYEMQIIIASHTIIKHDGGMGRFGYEIKENTTNAAIDFSAQNQTSHTIVFPHTLNDLQNIRIERKPTTNIVPTQEMFKQPIQAATFSFQSENIETSLAIHTHPQQAVYALKDAQLLCSEYNCYAIKEAAQPNVNELAVLSKKFNMIIFVFSAEKKTTLVIGPPNNILSNPPLSQRSDLISTCIDNAKNHNIYSILAPQNISPCSSSRITISYLNCKGETLSLLDLSNVTSAFYPHLMHVTDIPPWRVIVTKQHTGNIELLLERPRNQFAGNQHSEKKEPCRPTQTAVRLTLKQSIAHWSNKKLEIKMIEGKIPLFIEKGTLVPRVTIDEHQHITPIVADNLFPNTIFIVKHPIGSHSPFFRKDDNLIISNLLANNTNLANNTMKNYLICIEKFYITPMLQSLTLIFNDHTLVLKNHTAEIQAATLLKQTLIDMDANLEQAFNDILSPNSTSIHHSPQKIFENSIGYQQQAQLHIKEIATARTYSAHEETRPDLSQEQPTSSESWNTAYAYYIGAGITLSSIIMAALAAYSMRQRNQNSASHGAAIIASLTMSLIKHPNTVDATNTNQALAIIQNNADLFKEEDCLITKISNGRSLGYCKKQSSQRLPKLFFNTKQLNKNCYAHDNKRWLCEAPPSNPSYSSMTTLTYHIDHGKIDCSYTNSQNIQGFYCALQRNTPTLFLNEKQNQKQYNIPTGTPVPPETLWPHMNPEEKEIVRYISDKTIAQSHVSRRFFFIIIDHLSIHTPIIGTCIKVIGLVNTWQPNDPARRLLAETLLNLWDFPTTHALSFMLMKIFALHQQVQQKLQEYDINPQHLVLLIHTGGHALIQGWQYSVIPGVIHAMHQYGKNLLPEKSQWLCFNALEQMYQYWILSSLIQNYTLILTAMALPEIGTGLEYLGIPLLHWIAQCSEALIEKISSTCTQVLHIKLPEDPQRIQVATAEKIASQQRIEQARQRYATLFQHTVCAVHHLTRPMQQEETTKVLTSCKVAYQSVSFFKFKRALQHAFANRNKTEANQNNHMAIKNASR